jgi:PAS domain S-box-containing protein
MFKKLKWPVFFRKTSVAIAGLLLMSVLIGGLINKQIASARDTRGWLTYTYVTINHINLLMYDLTKAESAQRLFLLDRKDGTLSSYFEMAGSTNNPGTVETEIQTLRDLTIDNAAQTHRIDRLQELVNQKIAYMSQTIALAHAAKETELNTLLHTGQDSKLMEEISSKIGEIERVEENLLNQRTEHDDKTNRRNSEILTGLCMLLVGLLSTGFSKIQRELIRRRRAEESLQEKINFQGAMLASAPYAIIAIDSEGLIKMFNPAAERMLGYSAAELIDRHTPEIYHKKEETQARAEELTLKFDRRILPDFHAYIAEAEEHDLEEREWTYVRKNGEEFPIKLSVQAMKNTDGTITGYLGIAQDITERKQIDRMKNEFISIVSHELRTPLTSIRGSLGLIISDVIGPVSEKARELITIAHNNSERLVRLINDILNIEKIESGDTRVETKPLELPPILKQAIAENGGYAQKYNVNLILDVPDMHFQVLANTDQLLQVITNLLSNAMKFSFAGGDVILSATQNEGETMIMVTDQGSGIPEEFKAKIFQKFAQADSSSTRQKGGTGLGLNISKALIEKMGGSISFSSRPGHTVFTVTLNNQPEISQIAVTANIPQSPVKTHKKLLIGENNADIRSLPKILHIEDDPDIANLISLSLSSSAEIVHVATLAEARKVLQSQRFDLAILDLVVPDGNTMEILPALTERTHPIPVIILSALETPLEIQKQVSASLIKSVVSEEKIIHIIQSLIGERVE